MLDGVEVLLFDIQDIGTRYYTYLSTMALSMEAAGEHGIPFVVLDRPNPIGGDPVQGNVLDPAFASFVGLYPVPMRHGLTAGEFARMAVGEFGVQVELSVAVADGWTRTMPYEETGIPWIAPSPNMPSVESALHYPGTCLFEGTPISVGRGTEIAFQQLGAPWLDGEERWQQRLMALGVPDVRFEAVRFTPREPGDGKFGGEEVGGVRLVAEGVDYDPTLAALALLVEIRAMSGDRWIWREGHFDRLAGTDALRAALDAGASYEELARRVGGGDWMTTWSGGRGICCTGDQAGSVTGTCRERTRCARMRATRRSGAPRHPPETLRTEPARHRPHLPILRSRGRPPPPTAAPRSWYP